MQDDSQQNQEEQHEIPSVEASQPHEGILNQTFGEVLQNKEAQERIMKSMHIGPEQFQKLLKTTENNPLTNMTMGQLFHSGFVQKAVDAQGGVIQDATQQIPAQQIDQTEPAQVSTEGNEVDPEQFNQMVNSENVQVLERDEMGNPTKIAVPQQLEQQPQKESFLDILKGLFK